MTRKKLLKQELPLSQELLKEAKKYPRIDKILAAKRLKLKLCARCLRKLHKAFNDRPYYYCTCDMDLVINLS